MRIRWFGVMVGYAYVHFDSPANAFLLDLLIGLGAIYTLFDTLLSRSGRVLPGQYPVVVSILEAVFIGLLCWLDTGLDSPFRYYYLLSLICCAIRHSSGATWLACAADCVSVILVHLTHPKSGDSMFSLVLLLVVLIWVTWAASSLAGLLRRGNARMSDLNRELRENQQLLESRIAERTRELQETQAQLMHQDKMAGFGLLAAGIAHEVGNPLTSVSSLIQMLQRHNPDDYTSGKLSLVSGQLTRIQGILRELINFSRPASAAAARFHVRGIIDDALNIARYYKGTRDRTITADIPDGLPIVRGVRDQLVQVIFNLVLNAIDATSRGGTIRLSGRAEAGHIVLEVADDGCGIRPEDRPKVFQPYFTTRREGTGLGLFVIRKLIHEHLGTVTFESIPGEGTTFQVRLPVE